MITQKKGVNINPQHAKSQTHYFMLKKDVTMNTYKTLTVPRQRNFVEHSCDLHEIN